MLRVLLFPFVLLLRLVALIVGLTGRLLAVTIGLALVVVGGLIGLTGIGLLIGVPMMAFGFLLVVRGLF